MKTLSQLLVMFICALLLSSMAHAQNLNNPKHIPNKFQNKINHVRLKAMTDGPGIQKDTEKEIDEAMEKPEYGFRNQSQIFGGSDCSVNVGNSVGSGLGADQNVIIAGDVINLCK